MSDGDDILVAVAGAVGCITLNRPHVLNALSLDMITELSSTLSAWRDSSNICCVIIDAAGDRAFCAGGDIQSLYRAARDGDVEQERQFWRKEYELNALIAHFEKPYVALVSGVVMGGGVGISLHGSHRVVTENTVFAMPECSIGLIPDVGASLLLAQAHGFVGEYLALTGARLGAADLIYCGLADHHVPKDKINELKVALVEHQSVEPIFSYAVSDGTAPLADIQDEIDRTFSQPTVPEIVEALNAVRSDWARDAQKRIEKASAISLDIALKTVRSARRHQCVDKALHDEYRFTARASSLGEFVEGTRAAVIDKDRNPNWTYPYGTPIPPDVIAAFSTPAPGGDLILEGQTT